MDDVNRTRLKNLTLMLIIALTSYGWALVALLDPRGPSSVANKCAIGFLLGTMFGQVSLAAGWCSLGPLALGRRLPLAVAWLATVVISLGTNMAHDSTSNLVDLVMIGGAMTGQFVLLQAILWPLRAWYGLRVLHRDDLPKSTDRGEHQFEIRQLMILTAIVAVVLGAGRFALGGLKAEERIQDWEGFLLFGVLALCSALVAVPLIAAALLSRRPAMAVGGALLLAIVVTALEMPVVDLLGPGVPSSETHVVFGLVNFFQCIWILGLLFLLRLGGYRLTSGANNVLASAPS